MYRIEKRFTIPIGHRLSKNLDKCFSVHGHNFQLLVGLRSRRLNENDMIMDFSELKSIVNKILDDYDHALLINRSDSEWASTLAEQLGIRIKVMHDQFNFDPTAERLSEQLFYVIQDQINKYDGIFVEYVTVYENENSKATYSTE